PKEESGGLSFWPDTLQALQGLNRLASENSGDRSIDARGLVAQFDLQFIGLLVICNKVFGDARCLSEILQSPSLDLCSAVDLVQALVQSFQTYRDESYFEGLWREIVEPTSKRKTKQSRRLDGHTVMSSTGERSKQTMETFRTRIFYAVLDTMLSELNRRFAKPNCEIMLGIQALNPSSNTFCQEEALFAFASIYECNTDDLKHEVYQMKRILERKVKSGIQKPSSIVELTKIIEPFKEVFHELFRLCKIAIAILVSTASCERSFSTLKLIKTHLRSTMDDDRLSSLGILSVEHLDLVLKLQPSLFGNVIPSSEKLILQSPPNTHCEDDVCYCV
uniref:HAT C-terminal dimerisation domain-containing protein n=1 Tax=Scophthalmus maximus TaxID=52904 RepID=A0A8D3DVJ6_SCOMX